MENTSLPKLSVHGSYKHCITTVAVDEYQNLRQLSVAEERLLTIYLDRYPLVDLMTIGTLPEFLTLGYLYNQAIIRQLDTIEVVQVDWDSNAVAVVTNNPQNFTPEDLGRPVVTSGCGQGTVYKNLIDNIAKQVIPVAKKISQKTIYKIVGDIVRHNKLYRTAGAIHGCGIYQDGASLLFVEDIGRHNAVDVISGWMWYHGISGEKVVLYTTGRLTAEMVVKAAQMRIPVLISRTGTTAMALKIAEQSGITLIGRAQRQHFFIYTGSERVCFDVTLPRKKFVANIVHSD